MKKKKKPKQKIWKLSIRSKTFFFVFSFLLCLSLCQPKTNSTLPINLTFPIVV